MTTVVQVQCKEGVRMTYILNIEEKIGNVSLNFIFFKLRAKGPKLKAWSWHMVTIAGYWFQTSSKTCEKYDVLWDQKFPIYPSKKLDSGYFKPLFLSEKLSLV